MTPEPNNLKLRGSRTATLIAVWFVLGLLSLAILSNLDFRALEVEWVVMSCLWLLLLLAALRATRLGVWVSHDGLECVTWFNRATYKWPDIQRLLAQPYAGILSKGANSALLAQVVIVTRHGTEKPLAGLVGFSSTLRRETKRIESLRP